MAAFIPSRLACAVAIILSITIITASSHAEQPIDSVPSAFGNYSLVDVQQAKDGEVVFLGRLGPAHVNHQQPDSARQLFSRKGNAMPTHLRLFRIPGKPLADGYLSLAYLDQGRKNGAGIYQYLKGEKKFVAHLQSRLKDPTFFQGATEDVFVGSRTGVVYRYHNGKLQLHDVAQEVREPDLQQPYRPIRFAAAHGEKNGPVCCYSIADPKYHKHALFDVLVTENDHWKRISLANNDGSPRRTGPACMTDPKTLRMLTYNKWINVDVATGKITEVPFTTPGDGNDKVKPTEVIALPDGTIVSLWRKLYRSFKKNDVDAFENERYFRIAEWKNDEWKIATVGLDRRIAAEHPHVVDPEDGLWIAAGEGGFVYRSSSGKYREFNYQHNMPTNAAKRMRMTGKFLWAFDNRRGVFRFDTTQLPQLPEEPKRRFEDGWTVFDSQTSMIGFGRPKFRLQPLLAPSGKVIQLRCTDDGGVEEDRIALPKFDDFELETDDYFLHRDSRGTSWVIPIPKLGLGRIARHVDGEWELFGDSKDADGFRLASFETAAAKLLDEGYTDGDFAPQIAFGDNGRVVVICENRLSYFDGKNWKEGAIPDPHAKIVTFHLGNVLIKRGNTGYRLDMSAWDDDTAKKELPWKKINLLSERRPSREAEAAILKSIPIAKPYSTECINGELMAISNSKIAIFHRKHWTVLPNEKSPFRWWDGRDQRHRFTGADLFGFSIGVDGEVVVQTRITPVNSYAILPPRRITVTQGSQDLGEVANDEATLKPEWQSSLDADNVIHRCRIDGGPWSEWMPKQEPIQPGLLLGNEHELELQLSSRKQIVRTDNLKYTFTVAYDAQPRFDALVEQLGDASFKAREAAEKQLLNFGQNFVPQLLAVAEDTDDAEIKKRITYILETLPKPPAIDD